MRRRLCLSHPDHGAIRAASEHGRVHGDADCDRGAVGAATFWWVEPVHVQWSPMVLVALAVTSLFATALAFSVQTWAQRWTSPTRTALIFSLEPVFAWITSFLCWARCFRAAARWGRCLS